MKLIVGLGNVGTQYHNTRHNIGFDVVEMLAITFGKQPKDFVKHGKAAALVLDLNSTHDCMLVKPSTMMNLSGEAVQALAHYYKIEPNDVWVVYDDVDLQFGQLRVRKGGSSAGHNGIKSVMQHLGDDFWRLRLGVANQYLATTPTMQYVLDAFNQEEASKLGDILGGTANYLESSLLKGELTDETLDLIPR